MDMELSKLDEGNEVLTLPSEGEGEVFKAQCFVVSGWRGGNTCPDKDFQTYQSSK